MKYFLALFLIACLIAPLIGQDKTEDEAILTNLKEVLWPQAYRTQDTVLLDQILAKEFQLIDASGGIYTKADEIAYIKANRPSYESFRFEITRLEIFENGVAVWLSSTDGLGCATAFTVRQYPDSGRKPGARI